MRLFIVLILIFSIFSSGVAFGDDYFNPSQSRDGSSYSASDWYELGNDYYDSGDYESAIQCYQQALGIDLLMEDAWYYQGMSFFDLDM